MQGSSFYSIFKFEKEKEKVWMLIKERDTESKKETERDRGTERQRNGQKKRQKGSGRVFIEEKKRDKYPILLHESIYDQNTLINIHHGFYIRR